MRPGLMRTVPSAAHGLVAAQRADVMSGSTSRSTDLSLLCVRQGPGTQAGLERHGVGASERETERERERERGRERERVSEWLNAPSERIKTRAREGGLPRGPVHSPGQRHHRQNPDANLLGDLELSKAMLKTQKEPDEMNISPIFSFPAPSI